MLQSLNGIPFTKNWKTSSQVKSERFNKTKTKQNKKKGGTKEKEMKLKQNNKNRDRASIFCGSDSDLISPMKVSLGGRFSGMANNA